MTAVLSYSAIHQRLRRTRGSASAYACIVCGKRAHEFACYPCDDADIVEGVNASGKPVTYVPSIDGFEPMCRRDHRAHDAARARRRRALAHLAVAPLPAKRNQPRDHVDRAVVPEALFDLIDGTWTL